MTNILCDKTFSVQSIFVKVKKGEKKHHNRDWVKFIKEKKNNRDPTWSGSAASIYCIPCINPSVPCFLSILLSIPAATLSCTGCPRSPVNFYSNYSNSLLNKGEVMWDIQYSIWRKGIKLSYFNTKSSDTCKLNVLCIQEVLSIFIQWLSFKNWIGLLEHIKLGNL